MIDTLAIILSGILAAVTAYFVGGRMGERKGRRAERSDIKRRALEDEQTRTQAGRDAVRDGRASGGNPDQRLRDNDQHW